MRLGNAQGKYHLRPTGLTTQVSINMTFSNSPKALPTGKVNCGDWSVEVGPCSSDQQDCLWNQVSGAETVTVKSPYPIPPRFMRGKEYLLKIRNKRILSFWDSHPWLHAYKVVSTTTCYLCCQRRRKRGRLDKVKRSSLFKFKVLKWPIINTSDGTEAVISENNSKIISPSKARPSPGAHADMHGSDRKAKDML